jgi:2-polyprenyl-3-methyl-5-hydroxy-6-metoxy-1,4-benzoquinol methylase
MRYAANGYDVHAEHAALSSERGARWLLDWITDLDSTYTALDYGCGRLRYSLALARACHSVTVVDSRRQFSRSMVIHGQKTTIPDFARDNSQNIHSCVAEEFSDLDSYDLALCVNVLSSIPNQRSRNIVMRTILRSLKMTGVALFVNQHRNSYFRSYNERKDVKSYFDGWLIPNRGKICFYGLIHPDSLAKKCRKIGYHVMKSGCKGESGYVLCAKHNGQQGTGSNAPKRRVPQL